MKKIRMIGTIIALMSIIGLIAAPAAMAATNMVQGTVIKADNGGVALLADQTGTRYQLEGHQNLSNMLGEHVEVTGKLGWVSGDRSIKVASIQRSNRPEGGPGI